MEYVDQTVLFKIPDHKIGNIVIKKDPVKVRFMPVGRNRFELHYPFSEKVNEEVHSMARPIWHGYDKVNPRKRWSVLNSPRTDFIVQYNQVGAANPYDWYKQTIKQAPLTRTNLYLAQIEMVNIAWTIRYCMFAAEMGLGKTLAAIQYLELLKEYGLLKGDIFWVGPHSALKGVKYDFFKWKTEIKPEFMTYQGLTKTMNNWPDGAVPPQVLILDESSLVSNEVAQMTTAAMHCSNAIHEEWGYDGSVVEMTGSPAAKSPVKWWAQIEILQPGYLKEPNTKKFKERLAIMESQKSETGGHFEKIITWYDNPKKCKLCGQFENAIDHAIDHKFVPSKNEIEYLFKRLQHIVLVKKKKDCLDLPDKRYEIVRLPVSHKTKQLAAVLAKRAPRVVTSLILLRELSDGFIYEKEACGWLPCPVCKATGTELAWIRNGEVESEMVLCPICEGVANECDVCQGNGFIAKESPDGGNYIQQERMCTTCGGTGNIEKYKRIIKEVSCPKDDAVRDLLERCRETGRIVLYAGFQESVDRCIRICNRAGWDVIRIDGRGWKPYSQEGGKWEYGDNYLDLFQNPDSPINQFAAVGNPEAGGMGTTFTRSSLIGYYSNSYKTVARIQSEDRIHRIGMDYNRGATIVDLVHLPEDEGVLTVLKSDRDLQDMSLGKWQEIMDRVNSEHQKEINHGLSI